MTRAESQDVIDRSNEESVNQLSELHEGLGLVRVDLWVPKNTDPGPPLTWRCNIYGLEVLSKEEISLE